MARLIVINGAPASGKSTLARRYTEEHPGTLDCDIDQLRTWVGGWREDYAGTGEVVRPLALALIGAHLAGGRDVVLPQLLSSAEELDRFAAVAAEAGAECVEVLLLSSADVLTERLRGRTDPVDRAAAETVAAQGGLVALLAWLDKLDRLAEARPGTRTVLSLPDGVDQTYARFLAALG